MVVLNVALYLDSVELLACDSEIGVDVIVVLLEEFIGNVGVFAKEEGELYTGWQKASVHDVS